MLESFYIKSPFFIKCILASLKGAYLKKLRYDATSLLRIDSYLERETWDRRQWQDWIDSKLSKVLYNARNYVPYYQKYWSKSNKSYEYLENWPILTKKMINEFGCTGLLADEVGLGKTVEAGIVIKELFVTGLIKIFLEKYYTRLKLIRMKKS